MPFESVTSRHAIARAGTTAIGAYMATRRIFVLHSPRFNAAFEDDTIDHPPA